MKNQLQAMAYAQGRLVAEGVELISEDGKILARTGSFRILECAINARRLAACWNAFENVTTEGVEVLGVSLIFKGTHVAKLATARAALEAANIACADLANGLRTSMIALAATQEELAGARALLASVASHGVRVMIEDASDCALTERICTFLKAAK
jgi:hypothetical protein